jgi:hypothetical protein
MRFQCLIWGMDMAEMKRLLPTDKAGGIEGGDLVYLTMPINNGS